MRDVELTEATARPTVSELIAVIGAQATRKLCAQLGGIMREVGPPSKLFVDAIGEDAAIALRDYWGTDRIYIPRRPLSTRSRWELVWRLADEGFTRQQIALKADIGERQVYAILAKRPPQSKPAGVQVQHSA